jgi:hypothetical protein
MQKLLVKFSPETRVTAAVTYLAEAVMDLKVVQESLAKEEAKIIEEITNLESKVVVSSAQRKRATRIIAKLEDILNG